MNINTGWFESPAETCWKCLPQIQTTNAGGCLPPVMMEQKRPRISEADWSI